MVAPVGGAGTYLSARMASPLTEIPYAHRPKLAHDA